jgi:predicted NAD/FAD-binding protein
MLLDILRFNRESPKLLQRQDQNLTLNEYLEQGRYSPDFIKHYILPMGAAIWSANPAGMGEVPARFFVRFFHNHGLLSVDDRPTWRTITGGSRQYVLKLVEPFRDRIWLNTPVEWLRPNSNGVELKARGLERQEFDRVFLACHSDQALALLQDPTVAEREVLGAFAYQPNEAILHTDSSLMPGRKLAWAAWNYHLRSDAGSGNGRVSLSYNMNILQGLKASVDFLVTLNHCDAIDPARVIARLDYEHPVFDLGAVAAQARHRELNGSRNVYFCGAYWGNGFHEDGVVSALTAVEHFREDMKRSPPQAISQSDFHTQPRQARSA